MDNNRFICNPETFHPLPGEGTGRRHTNLLQGAACALKELLLFLKLKNKPAIYLDIPTLLLPPP